MFSKEFDFVSRVMVAFISVQMKRQLFFDDNKSNKNTINRHNILRILRYPQGSKHFSEESTILGWI